MYEIAPGSFIITTSFIWSRGNMTMLRFAMVFAKCTDHDEVNVNRAVSL